jgi:putative endonuclease
MIDSSTRDLGRRGEEIALRYLARKGYQILERNYRCRYGEIDLIARDGDTLVFVEVKSRKSDIFGMPEESVGRAKQRKISTVALHYLTEKTLHGRRARFDVVSIVTTSGEEKITHIPDAFDFVR